MSYDGEVNDPDKKMAEFEELRSMVSSFRVSELQVLLGFAGRNKSGRKHELLLRVLHLLKNASCSPAVQIKIKELYRRRYPRTIDTSHTDLAAIKSAFSTAAEVGCGVTLVTSDLSDLSPDGAGVSRDSDQVSDSLLLSGDSLVLSGDSLQLHEETYKELRMNLQQPAPLIPPVHPDVQMKSLPFYDVLDILIKPSSLGASTVQRYHQEKYFIFALTPQQVREVCISRDFLPGGRRDYMVQIQLRFCLSETSCPQEDNYPNSLCIKVNGKLFPLPGYAPPPKNGVEQKRPGRPLNITSLVRLSSAVPNQISVTWAAEIGKTYSMSVYLVRQLTSPLLLQRLRMKGIRNPDHSRALIKEKLTADPDSEIATTSLRVSLMCPLGKMRLTVPCRAVTCSHLQCFDAALYLQMNEKKPTWVCPVCDKKAPYESLIIDGLFMEILNDCSDVDEIKFQEDGTWCPMRPKKEALNVSSTCIPKIEPRLCAVVPSHSEPSSANKKADVIDLTLESSSEEEEEEEEDPDPPLKKRCLYMSKTEEVHAKGVLTYQPSTVRLPNVQALDTPYLMSSLADYAVPFHHSTLSTIPTDMQSLDLFSLIQGDSQHYRAPMFLDNLTSSLQGATTSAALVSSSSQYEPSSHHHTTTTSSSSHETGVITGGAGSNSISDIISLD
ncbi:E3 SUMO-protein ligase PIAS2 isoform X1 [Coregonus clupeaformis]|uniref:E3 SUMO-protein ligase PIAS2 isoform X1 n=2 Tax=Coregonus clupeaformis TaxID=59861 RepID=UPI001E1C71FC|nr:E3 SUMO-protein ligase PIAS2 isoform X1 [Coregonus clupeaformis]